MKIINKIIIELSETEYSPLKTLLGNMTDDEFAKFGVKGEDREIMRELYNSIPFNEDDE